MSIIVRGPRDYDKFDHCGIDCSKPIITKQSFKDECDINNIMMKYIRTGLIDHVNRYQGRYGDFSDVPDLLNAFDIIEQSEEMFESLPSDIRKEFNNDVVLFLEFAQDPANADKLKDYGLIPDDRTPANPVPAGSPDEPVDSPADGEE